MKINQRIWKTAALAAAITIVGSMFVMRLGDWSKGLNSEFIVYGDTGTSGTGGGSGTTIGGNITKIIPHMVAGGGYRTFVEVINTGATTANVTAAFYVPAKNADGTSNPGGSGSLSTETFTTDLSGKTGTFSGSMSAVALAASQILVIALEKSDPNISVNWGQIQSNGPVTVAAAFELRDGNKNLVSRVGVGASAADIKQFVIPRIRHVGRGLDIGYAIVNTGSNVATITATLRDASGQNVLATKSLTLGPMNQIAIFTREFFGGALTESDSGDKVAFQSLTFASVQGQFSALALAIEGGQLASFPVDRLQ